MKSLFTTALLLILSLSSVASATQYVCTLDGSIMNPDEIRFDTETRKASMVIGTETYNGELTLISKHNEGSKFHLYFKYKPKRYGSLNATEIAVFQVPEGTFMIIGANFIEANQKNYLSSINNATEAKCIIKEETR